MCVCVCVFTLCAVVAMKLSYRWHLYQQNAPNARALAALSALQRWVSVRAVFQTLIRHQPPHYLSAVFSAARRSMTLVSAVVLPIFLFRFCSTDARVLVLVMSYHCVCMGVCVCVCVRTPFHQPFFPCQGREPTRFALHMFVFT